MSKPVYNVGEKQSEHTLDQVTRLSQEVEIYEEAESLTNQIQRELDAIVASVQRLSFGGQHVEIMQRVNAIAKLTGCSRYAWRVNIKTGQSERE